MVQCYRTDWNEFSIFTAGTTYFVYVEIDLKDDTSFEFAHHDSDITALVNGTPVEDYVVVDSDSTWESNFNTSGGVRLSYGVYFTAKGEPTGVTVSGTATSFGSDTDDVTIQLIKSGASEASYETVVKGNSASYSIKGVAPGTYTMKVMKNKNITREYTVTVSSNNVTQNVYLCLLGDVNDDGLLNTDDYSMIKAYAMGDATFDDVQKSAADLTHDGAVDAYDAICLDLYLNGLIEL